MSKLDKKIISMILVLIILISQFSIVFAADTEKTTLEQYLKENGLDINNEQDCLDIVRLDLVNLTDLEKIEKAVNLKSLSISDCDASKIDFTVFTKLEYLYIAGSEVPEIDFSKLTNLKSLRFSNIKKGLSVDFSKLINLESLDLNYVFFENKFSCDGMINLKSLLLNVVEAKELDLSGLARIENLDIYNSLSNYENIIFPDFKYLKDIYISDTCGFSINLSQSENIKNVYIDNIKDLSQITLPEKEAMFTSFIWSANDLYNISTINLNKELNMYVGERINYFGYGDLYCRTSDENIIKVENTDIVALKIGKTQIELEDMNLNRKYTINVNVIENNWDKPIENTNITAKIIDYGAAILKSNGELWKINSETTAEKIDDNVKKYVYSQLYSYMSSPSELTLYNDNKLNIKSEIYGVSDTIENNISNVKDIMECGGHSYDTCYLTNDGDLYSLIFNDITGKIITEKVNDNLKKIVNDYIIKNDNTTWTKMYGKDFIKIADFEIKDSNGNRIVDMNNTLYEYSINEDGSVELTKQQENFEGFDKENDTFFGNLFLNGDGVAYIQTEEQNINILNNVTSIGMSFFGGYTLIRKDGTIWVYTEGKGLTKIDKSTVIEEDNNHKTEDEIYLRNKNMKSKSLSNRTALVGLTEAKTIKDFKAQNNFESNFKVEILNIKNEPLADEAFIGTGDKIRLYAGDKLVKEYTAIIYGDTDGNGEITAIDALAIIMNRTKKNEFSDIAYVEAGRLESSGDEVPSAIDALAIIMYKTGKYTINQAK